MANLIMFTALLLLVMPFSVYAQSSTVMILDLVGNSTTPMPQASASGSTSAHSGIVGSTSQFISTVQPTTAVPPTTTVQPTPVVPPTTTGQPTTAITTAQFIPTNPTGQATAAGKSTVTVQPTPTSSSSNRPTTSPCPVLNPIPFSSKSRTELNKEIVNLTKKHEDEEKYWSCTKNDNCCEGKGETDITLSFNNCPQYKYVNVSCVEILGICQCRAGFLSASFLVTIIGMIFFFID